jgi:hypothetical protein
MLYLIVGKLERRYGVTENQPIKWTHRNGEWTSECGRFLIRNDQGIFRLHDKRESRIFSCKSLTDAKARANLIAQDENRPLLRRLPQTKPTPMAFPEYIRCRACPREYEKNDLHIRDGVLRCPCGVATPISELTRR